VYDITGPEIIFSVFEIIKEGTMSTVNTAFIAGPNQGFTFQTIVLIVVLLFIFKVYNLVFVLGQYQLPLY
jgi:hypothetical protein